MADIRDGALGMPLVNDAPIATELIGRDRELARMEAVLERRQPALIVVTGEPGIGKTSLLREFQARASRKHWNTAPNSGQDELSITPATDEQGFRNRLQEMLRLSLSDSFLDLTLRRGRLDSTLGRGRLDSLIEQIRSRAPLLLLINGYNPAPRFAQWFTGTFIKEIKQADIPVVVGVAERPDRATTLSPLANEIVPLGPLDVGAVRRHFQELGQQIVPPMRADELERYVQASNDAPTTLNALTRVLQLAQPRDTSSAASYGGTE